MLTVSQENLTLSIWASRLCIGISVSKLIAGFHVDVSTLRNGAEECIREIIEREYGVP
jgi:hypothetical protein